MYNTLMSLAEHVSTTLELVIDVKNEMAEIVFNVVSIVKKPYEMYIAELENIKITESKKSKDSYVDSDPSETSSSGIINLQDTSDTKETLKERETSIYKQIMSKYRCTMSTITNHQTINTINMFHWKI